MKFIAMLIAWFLSTSVFATGANPAVLSGTVAGKKQGEILVSLTSNGTLVPLIGDPVTFSAKLRGIDVRAGQGEITEVSEEGILVSVTEGKPGFNMSATVHASGKRITDPNEPGSMVTQTLGKLIAMSLPRDFQAVARQEALGVSYTSKQLVDDRFNGTLFSVIIAPLIMPSSVTTIEGHHRRLANFSEKSMAGFEHVYLARTVPGRQDMLMRCLEDSGVRMFYVDIALRDPLSVSFWFDTLGNKADQQRLVDVMAASIKPVSPSR